MKNTKLFPFERNKYYYGKLLSVEDFTAEQRYMNDKRRLINRLVHGIGVVSGLNVTCVDDRTISIDSGLAFDNTGREIVVDAPVTKKLSLINGYENACAEGSAYVYLCLEYSESEKGEAHNISSQGSQDKIGESYNIYLTASEPDDGIENDEDLFEKKITVFRDGNICVKHVLPRYVHPDERFTMRVEIESYAKQYAAFSYDVQLICLNTYPDNKSILRVNFDEMLFEKTGKYALSYELTASDVSNTLGEAHIDDSTFTLSYDKISAEGSVDGKCEVSITDENISDKISKDCYRYGMDTVMRNTASQLLYLARINLVDAGGSIIIENIENVPFGQYVANLPLLRSLSNARALKNGSGGSAGYMSGLVDKKSDGEPKIASGVARINLNAGSLKNRTFYSDEIVHGLGLGSVTIILGTPTLNGEMIFGNTEIFKSDVPEIDVAAKLLPSNGSFIIGLLTKSSVIADFVDVKWTAIRDIEEATAEKSSMSLKIKPGSLVLKPRESKYLEAVCTNMTNKTVRWSVSSEFGGEIDANGMYVAPNTEGVYEVIARSAVYPEIKASIMVVVRE